MPRFFILLFLQQMKEKATHFAACKKLKNVGIVNQFHVTPHASSDNDVFFSFSFLFSLSLSLTFHATCVFVDILNSFEMMPYIHYSNVHFLERIEEI